MKHALLLFIQLLVFKTAFSQSAYQHFTIKTLGTGVWAAFQNDPYGHAICNAGIFDLGDKTVVFDPFMNPDAALELKKAAFALTHKPVAIVINSHSHNDHIRGNQVFENSAIISTFKTRELIEKQEPRQLEWEKKNAEPILKNFQAAFAGLPDKKNSEIPFWIGYFDGIVKNKLHIKTTLPTICFNDSLVIHGKNFNLHLKAYCNGHTESDVVVLLPHLQTAFMGDLLFVERFPSLSDGNPLIVEKIIESYLTTHAYKQFVPGHGPLGSKVDLQAFIRYLHALKNSVGDKKKRNQPDSLTLLEKPGKDFSNWKLSRFHAENLEFYCKHPEYYQ